MYSYSVFFFSSRRRHTRSLCDWSSDVCSSDLISEVIDTEYARLESLPVKKGGRIAFHPPCTLQHGQNRSEEHTSELQSHSDLVCRLLLEKKKKKYMTARRASRPM